MLPRLGLVLALVLALPATAHAATTNVDQPADPTYWTVDNTPPNVTVHGTVTGGVTQVDVWCLTGTSEDYPIQNDLAVSGGAFEVTVVRYYFNEGGCHLVALPEGVDKDVDDLSGYTGPLVITDYRQTSTTPHSAEGSPDVPYDFLFSHAQPNGLFALYSLFRCGVCSGRLFYEDTESSSEYVFLGNGALDIFETPDDRANARVDGHNAWGSYVGAIDVDSGAKSGWDLAGVPPLSFVATGGGHGEDLAVDEEEDMVRCAGGDPYPLTSSGCGSFVRSGVRVHRRARQTRGGTLLTLADAFRSTDGQPHALDLLWTQDFGSADAGTQFPWTGGGYSTRTAGETIPGADATPVAFFVKTNNAAPDGNRRYAQGLVMYDRPVGEITALKARELLVPTQLAVPAGGEVVLRQAYAMATTRAELEQIAAQVAGDWEPPAVAFAAPADGATVDTAEVTVTGTARDNHGVASLTVDGRAVPVGADGTWSTTATLHPGANTLTAIVRDVDGNDTTATRSVTFTPRPPGPPLGPSVVPDVTAPVLSGVSLSATTFRVAAGATAVAAATRRGTTVRYTLSEAAKVGFAVSRATKGRRVGGRCRRATAKNRRKRACTRYVKAGRTITRASAAGASTLRFTGRIGTKKLKPGRYRMAVAATDAVGNRSKARKLKFRIVRR
ncbi:MAG TPA: Ig-like domain-containing protein [Solirubrobacteraceae bacterium]|jgi:hypothetical protein